MSTRDEARAHADAAVTSGRFIDLLAGLVCCRSESQEASQAPELAAYLNHHLIPLLTPLGFDCEVMDNPHGGPILLAERIEDADRPTVLSYGHGDVIRGQDDQWSQGMEPFTLTQRGDRLYGRGTADNKSQHLINILALKAVLETRGHLGFNMRLLIEMSEETGSPGLDAFCDAHRDRLAADVLIASDGPRLDRKVPTVFLGARGAMNFDLAVNLRDGAQHSGNWGGLLADPAQRLVHALATICDARGAIRIPDWRPTSLTEDIRALIRDLPASDGSGPAIDPDWGEPDLTPAERVLGWNSFAILAMHSGRPEAPVNAIAGSARATCQLRYVVGTDPAAILPALRAHLDAGGFADVVIEGADEPLWPATRSDPDHPWVRMVMASLASAGKPPHLVPNLGGSLPNHVFAKTLDLPTIWIPHSYRGCAQHAPDEHTRLSLCRNALELMTGLFWDIGATESPPT